MRRAILLALLLTTGGAFAAVTGPASAATTLRACKGQPGFRCGTLSVPLDRADRSGAKVRLKFAIQSSKAQRRKPVLVALAGGPGQGAVSFGSSFADSLRPALAKYRLAVIDQRGTGGSGALSCPQLQKLSTLGTGTPAQAARCAREIGPRRAFYATRDSVADLDALRVHLHEAKLALMGVSYGTYVAVQYARVHPTTTRALILDSIVGPNGVDPFLLDTSKRLPRVLREQCAGSRCSGVTRDPVADVGRVARAIGRGGVSGIAFDAQGRGVTTSYREPDELGNLLIAGDLNPFLQAALPGAIAAAGHGDRSLLLRLVKIGIGAPSKLSDLSAGLLYATTCDDLRSPFPLSASFTDRRSAIDTAFAAIPKSAYAPFDAASVLRESLAVGCERWPRDVVTPPSTAPLPDVPALLLSGRYDLRTPLENGTALAKELPRARIVRVPGTGHDELDSDVTGCARKALTRWVHQQRLGDLCHGLTNAVDVLPLPPTSLRTFRSATGVGGDRGRALFAAVDTAYDARITLLQNLYAGLDMAGGGLHGGRFSAHDLKPASRGIAITLTRYAYVPGLRVSGTVQSSRGVITGRLRVSGRGQSGVLRLLRSGAVDGRLGGRAVHYSPRRARASAARVGSVGGPRLAALARPVRLPARVGTARP